MRLLMTWLSAILLCVTTSCTNMPQGYSVPQDNASNNIQVDNENWADVTVYVLVNGSRTRIGEVTSLTKESLSLGRTWKETQIRILVHPLAGVQDWVSDEIDLHNISRMLLTVQQPLTYSHLEFYRREY